MLEIPVGIVSQRIAIVAAAALIAATLASAPAAALVTTYGSAAGFAAATSLTAFADFESEATGYTANPLVSSYAVPQTPNSIGYFGLASTTTIGSAVLIVDRGWVENVAIDNISIASLVASAPEPASWALLLAGFGHVGLAMRRRPPPAVSA